MAGTPFDRGPDPFMFAPLQGEPLAATDRILPDIETPDTQAPGEEENDYAARVRGIVDDAREFNAEVLTPIRERGIQFYLGLEPDLDEEGSSSIVATEVRDTVLQVLPSLMRIFTSENSTVVFMPSTQASAKIAEQQTDYIQYVFNYDNPGYMILQDVFKDACIKSMGVVQWWTDDNLEAVEDRYERLNLEQRQYLIADRSNEVVEEKLNPRPGPQGEIIPSFDMTIRRTKRAPKHCVASIPPDEFRINRSATKIKDAALVGREWFETQSNLIRKGVPRDLIDECRDFSGGDMRFTTERMLRNQGADSPFGRDYAEPLCRYGEYWIRIDKDGDGIAELRHICVIGDGQTIVMDEPAARAKMAICCPDPEPHSIVGHSISELVADLQVIKTNLLRSSLDSLANSIWPRIWGVENLVNWDDVMNQAIGAPIRVKDPTAIGQFQYDFIGEDAFNMMDRLDAMRMARTGITEQSKGLDPKALQSTTLKGVQMIITGAQERIELIARTMAYTFMTDLFSGLLQEVTENPVPERVVKLRGEYVPVPVDQFDATMNCVPHPSMGRGSDMDKFVMLQTVLAKQELIVQSMGAANPMVTPVEYRNALEDLVELAGSRNSERYFRAMTPEAVQTFMDQMGKKEDPALVLAKAEADKVRAEVVKTLTDARVKTEDLTLKDDRERDKFEGDQLLKAFDIDAKYGAAVDTAAIAALWSAPRIPPTSGSAQGASIGGLGSGAPSQPAPMGDALTPMGAGPKPKLPARAALGMGPPQLQDDGEGGYTVGRPTGLLNAAGPGAGG